MKYLFLLAMLLGCDCNHDRQPTLIATVEGCHVYEIQGAYNRVYTTICPNGRTTTEYDTGGKHSENVPNTTERKAQDPGPPPRPFPDNVPPKYP